MPKRQAVANDYDAHNNKRTIDVVGVVVVVAATVVVVLVLVVVVEAVVAMVVIVFCLRTLLTASGISKVPVPMRPTMQCRRNWLWAFSEFGSGGSGSRREAAKAR